MSPALSPLVSVLERAATLIEKGVAPAKALRQVAKELEEFETSHAGSHIPPRAFSELLGVPHRRAA